jgi:hypothetical protein
LINISNDKEVLSNLVKDDEFLETLLLRITVRGLSAEMLRRTERLTPMPELERTERERNGNATGKPGKGRRHRETHKTEARRAKGPLDVRQCHGPAHGLLRQGRREDFQQERGL